MWNYFTDFVNAYIGPLETSISFATFFFVLVTLYSVTFGRKKRERKNFEHVRTSPGQRPVILVVDLNKDIDIRNAVENYRRQIPDLADLPLYHIPWDFRKHLKSEDMVTLVKKIREKKSEIADYAADLIHLFYGGPILPAALVGTEFANGCRVILYHHNQGNYENWGPLRHDIIE